MKNATASVECQRRIYTLVQRIGARIGAKSVNEGTLFKKYNFVVLMLLCFGVLSSIPGSRTFPNLTVLSFYPLIMHVLIV